MKNRINKENDDIQIDGIKFKNGYLATQHCQDCCEIVYAGWEALADTTFNYDIDIKDIQVEQMDFGFRINDYFIPCYNSQNGYYDSSLQLIAYNNNDDIIKTYGFINVKDTGEQIEND